MTRGFKPIAWLLAIPIHIYRLFISPLLPRNCRFAPSCSEYALEALARHGPWRGLWLTARRVARCHPFGGGSGFDPVPDTTPRGDAPSRERRATEDADARRR